MNIPAVEVPSERGRGFLGSQNGPCHEEYEDPSPSPNSVLDFPAAARSPERGFCGHVAQVNVQGSPYSNPFSAEEVQRKLTETDTYISSDEETSSEGEASDKTDHNIGLVSPEVETESFAASLTAAPPEEDLEIDCFLQSLETLNSSQPSASPRYAEVSESISATGVVPFAEVALLLQLALQTQEAGTQRAQNAVLSEQVRELESALKQSRKQEQYWKQQATQLLFREADVLQSQSKEHSQQVEELEGALKQTLDQEQHWKERAEKMQEERNSISSQAEELLSRTQRELDSVDAELQEAHFERKVAVEELAKLHVKNRRLEQELRASRDEVKVQAKHLKERQELGDQLMVKLQVYKEECKIAFARLAELEDHAVEKCESTKKMQHLEQELQIVSSLLYKERGAK